jgi:signal transduction histidine kinase
VFLADEETGRLRLAMRRGDRPVSYWELDTFDPEEGFVGRVAAGKNMLIVADPPPEPGFSQEVFLGDGLRMLMGIPLLAKSRLLGVIVLAFREVFSLTARQKVLLEAIGLSVGTAVENGLLHRQSQRLAVLEERERIGMDLHDGIIQSIYAVGLMLEECLIELKQASSATRPKVERAIAGLNSVIRDIRAYINDLQPQRFIFDNLAVGLELLVRDFQVNTPVSVETALSEEAARGLAPATANTLFHIAQEALGNVNRHAHATRVRLSLEQVEDRVVLEVADNGRGFDPDQQAVCQGHGLANMEERAHGVQGELTIQSWAGEGTLVRVSIPRIRPQTGNLAGRLPKGGPIRRV